MTTFEQALRLKGQALGPQGVYRLTLDKTDNNVLFWVLKVPDASPSGTFVSVPGDRTYTFFNREFAVQAACIHAERTA